MEIVTSLHRSLINHSSESWEGGREGGREGGMDGRRDGVGGDEEGRWREERRRDGMGVDG